MYFRIDKDIIDLSEVRWIRSEDYESVNSNGVRTREPRLYYYSSSTDSSGWIGFGTFEERDLTFEYLVRVLGAASVPAEYNGPEVVGTD